MMPPLDVTPWVVSWVLLYGLVAFLQGDTVPRGHPAGTHQAQLCRGASAESKHLHTADLHLPKNKPLFTQKHPGRREAPASPRAPTLRRCRHPERAGIAAG